MIIYFCRYLDFCREIQGWGQTEPMNYLEMIKKGYCYCICKERGLLGVEPEKADNRYDIIVFPDICSMGKYVYLYECISERQRVYYYFHANSNCCEAQKKFIEGATIGKNVEMFRVDYFSHEKRDQSYCRLKRVLERCKQKDFEMLRVEIDEFIEYCDGKYKAEYDLKKLIENQ